MKRILVRVLTLAENLWLDVRYGGGSLRGSVKSRFSSEGAHDTQNSEYRALRQMFAGRITPEDVLVDVGCGKGRVLIWWISRGMKNKIVGLELDPAIAEETRKRFSKYPNVTIISGDAVQNLPPDATIMYIANSFGDEVMERFRDRVSELFYDRAVTIIYYNPNHIAALRGAGWSGTLHTLPGLPHKYAVLTKPVGAPL